MLKALLPQKQGSGRPPAQSFKITAGPRPLSELLSLASAAARSGTSLSFTDVRSRPIEDLVRIAAVGGDCVSFRPDPRPLGDDRGEDEAAPPPPGAVRRIFGRLALR